MNRTEYIRSRFEKILSENINEKADEILTKLNLDKEVPFDPPGGPTDYVQESEVCEQCGGEMKEGEKCEQCGSKGEIMELGGMDSDHPKFGKLNLKQLSKRELEKMLGDDEEDEDDEWEEIDLDMETDWDKLEEEIEEELHGGQKKLDVAKPYGKLTKDDFKKLRSMKEEDDEQPLYEVEFELDLNEYSMGDDDLEGVKPYGDFSTDSPNIKPGRNQVKNVGDKYQRKISKKFDDYELEEGETEEGNAFTGALSQAKKEGKTSFEVDGKKYDVKESYITEKWKGDVDVKQTGEYSDMTIEELNAAIKKQKAKNDKTKDAGKKVSHADRTKMSQLYFAKRAKQGWKGKGKAKVTESLIFTENELI